MIDKDPKDMTSSELLRWATNGEPYNGVDGNSWTYPTGKIRALVEDVTGEWPSDHEAFSIIADKIDAELAEARKDAIRESKKPMWWFRNAIKCGYDWPEPRDGEKFRDYLHRCFLPRPRFEDGEVVGVREYEEIQGYCVYDDGEFFVITPNRSIDYAAGERVERPAPDVLGADGKPIKAGETVYRTDAPITEAVVVDFRKYDDGSIDVVCSEKGGKVRAFYSPSLLTHTPPDTQERIDEDKGKKGTEYWRCVGFLCGDCPAEIDGKRPSDRYGVLNCSIAQGMDIARRQADLDARKGGE